MAVADNPYLDLDYSGYHKNLIQLWYNIDQVESFSPTLADGTLQPNIFLSHAVMMKYYQM